MRHVQRKCILNSVYNHGGKDSTYLVATCSLSRDAVVSQYKGDDFPASTCS